VLEVEAYVAQSEKALRDAKELSDGGGTSDQVSNCLLEAQVYATLALASRKHW
jgi:hypothetical protein